VNPIDCAMADGELRTLKAVEQFLFREARVLDLRDYEGWLGMLTGNMHYIVRAQQIRESDARAVSYALIDEEGPGLRSRIDQIKNARLSRAENPPSLARRLISNVEVLNPDRDRELHVSSYIMAFRTRASVPQGGFYVGQRSDVIQMTESGLRLARRDVLLDHAILFDGALTTIL
jgi:3-phenylpropionate/cinnamic acid dioxygenase small subunit